MFCTAFLNQFLKDLTLVDNLRNLRWVFDKKSSFTQSDYLRQQVMKAIKDNPSTFDDPAIWRKFSTFLPGKQIDDVDDFIKALDESTEWFDTIFSVL